jgi:uncharacterized protein YbjT (DUF2867 family)
MGLILVTGGTGTLGRIVVQRLTAQGRDVRVLSRRPPQAGCGPAAWATGDPRRARGIGAAVAGADVIVHCATGFGDVGSARHLITTALVFDAAILIIAGSRRTARRSARCGVPAIRSPDR